MIQPGICTESFRVFQYVPVSTKRIEEIAEWCESKVVYPYQDAIPFIEIHLDRLYHVGQGDYILRFNSQEYEDRYAFFPVSAEEFREKYRRILKPDMNATEVHTV